ncbi:MAG: GH92 family glycosyl hydrolase, partial [Bacteroidia bacterium]|nr:GH92 family glycosyl hydrolase [Bacteroidia bacterium]
KAEAGYYSVKLDNNIQAELTTTTRVGFHKYIFPKNEEARIVLQLDHRDKTLESNLKAINNKTIEGFRRSEAWAKDQHIYFVIEFSEAFEEEGTIGTGNEKGIIGPLFSCFSFGKLNNNPLYIKIGVSNVSIEGARKNLKEELPHWDFEKVKSDAKALWNKELSKIEITSTDKNRLTIFYTALYHTMIQPNVAMDVDGMYRGRDNKIYKAEGFTYYSVFSLWDTFRATHPLYTLIDKKRTSDFINTFLAQYEQGGRLPVWELASNETDCMIGYHSVSVIADAMIKGIKGFDYEKAFEASKHSAMLDHLGLDAYKKNGFISMDDEHESVSKTVEYAYDDWCIAQMAKLLNKKSDCDYFMKRSQSWKNMFDTETGFMRAKKNGGWLSPFDPREVNNNYTEGNSWQYSFFVPHDVQGLIEMMGGSLKFEQKLDELFSTSNKTTGREQVDITGLVGQYAHGNEPSHHMAYLYNYVNKPIKTQERVTQLLNEFYKNSPDGLIGNEDCGQMSAWYVLSSMGIYPVCPGKNTYDVGKCIWSNVKINLENGSTIELNPTSKLLNETTVQLIKSPNNTSALSDYKTKNIIPVPIIYANSKMFTDSLLVNIQSNNKQNKIMLSINNTEFKEYVKPFYIYQSSAVSAYTLSNDDKSTTVKASFYKKPNNWNIQLISKYNAQYTAGGNEGLIDGIRGETSWRKGEWQGYQYQNFECIIDLKKETTINYFSSGYLQDTRSWILMPTKVEYYTSSDNINFQLVATVNNTIDAKNYDVIIRNFEAKFANSVKAKYIKVKAYNFGTLPEWHQGAGDQAFIFIDEIELK